MRRARRRAGRSDVHLRRQPAVRHGRRPQGGRRGPALPVSPLRTPAASDRELIRPFRLRSWWSQGCSIGCDYCLTDPKHPDNKGQIPTKAITGNPPHADKAGFRKSYCDNPKTESVLPKEFWTLNLHAIPGAVNDSYRHNPWRAPGSAPVVDPWSAALPPPRPFSLSLSSAPTANRHTFCRHS